MNQRSNRVLYLALGAVIAALYAVLTYAAGIAGLAYGPVQFRFSEALTVLPMFTPAAIPGLTIGCLLSNIFSGYGIYDLIFGTAATLLAAILTRAVRKVRYRGIPVLAPLPPVIINALVVGLEITVVAGGKLDLASFNWILFWSNAGSVGLGELVICYVLGLPLAMIIERNKKLKSLLRF
ncbi:MAG TPA: QueT transporter family protein [Caproicibacter sp.]|nr:QueT transporter family protein [Caproicibacter sp.]